MSFMIRGTVAGVKTITRQDREGNPYAKTYIGFETPKVNGYPGETQVTDVQVSRDQLSNGLPAYYEKIKGQEVIAPIFIMPWKNGGNYTVFFEGEGKCQTVNSKAA